MTTPLNKLKSQDSSFEGAGMMQWWQRSPPKNVSRVQLRPLVTCRLSLLLALTLLWGFFSGFSGFPPSTKINISKFQFDQHRRARVKTSEDFLSKYLTLNDWSRGNSEICFLRIVSGNIEIRGKQNSLFRKGLVTCYIAKQKQILKNALRFQRHQATYHHVQQLLTFRG